MTNQIRDLSDGEIGAVAGGIFTMPIVLRLLLSIKGCQDGSSSTDDTGSEPREGDDDDGDGED
jgi:hypothetical protein